MSVSVRAHPPALSPQRLDRPRALDRLGQSVGHVGVGRALAQVALRRALEVPPGAEHDDRHAEQDRQREERADDDQRADREHHGDGGDEDLGHRLPHAARERVDVPGGTGEQVAGARLLDCR